MNKKTICVIAAGLLFPLAVLADPARTCSPSRPPTASAATENHGIYLFFYPKELSKNYTGCQTMWNEKGQPLIVLVFRAGELIRYEYIDAEKPAESGICVYRKGALIKGDGDLCPDYADAKKGFRAIKDEASFRVPIERDPRARYKGTGQLRQTDNK